MTPIPAHSVTVRDAAGDALAEAVARLKQRSDIVLARTPLIDPCFPDSTDLDLLVFGDVDGILPERLTGSRDSRVRTDVVWLPRRSLADPSDLARQGLIAHRVLASQVVHDPTGYGTRQCERLRSEMYRQPGQTQRLIGFLDLGFSAVREIGVTWDFPALALFWLHMAAAACVAVMLDVSRQLCPNVYTRPLEHLRKVDAPDRALERAFVTALRLDVGPSALAAPLRRIHRIVSRRFPEPEWPTVMRQATRYEYRYFGGTDELEWRLGVAEEMTGRGEGAAAVFYLRFWAYALARLPMVHQRAKEGVDVSFVRPERAVRPDLETHCPDILDDLSAVLGGPPPFDLAALSDSLTLLQDLRERAVSHVTAQGIELAGLRPWRPFKPPP